MSTATDPQTLKFGMWGPPVQPSTEPKPDTLPPKHKWGLVDVGLFLVALVVGQVVGLVALTMLTVAQVGAPETATPEAIDAFVQDVMGQTSTFMGMLVALCTQWVAFLWIPWRATAKKGHRSLAKDFGLRFKRSDVYLGLLFAVAMQGVGVAITLALSAFGVDVSEAENVDMVTSHGGALLVLMIFSAVVAAPLTEELLFRGLMLRALMRTLARVDHADPLPGTTDTYVRNPPGARRRRIGIVVSVAISTLAFASMHAPYVDGQGSFDLTALLVLMGQTAVLGAFLAVVAVRTRRLGLNIATHAWYNGISVTLALLLS